MPPWAVALLYGTPAVLAFIDAQRHADQVWRMAGHSLLFCTLVIVLIPRSDPRCISSSLGRAYSGSGESTA